MGTGNDAAELFRKGVLFRGGSALDVGRTGADQVKKIVAGEDIGLLQISSPEKKKTAEETDASKATKHSHPTPISGKIITA